jgi:hypothetical protein
MQQRRVAAGNRLSTGLGTMIKYVRRTASGAAGYGLGTSIKYLHAQEVPITSNCRLICRVFFSCCGSVAWPQAVLWAPA